LDGMTAERAIDRTAAPAAMDLVVAGGTVITAGSRSVTDIGVRDGKVVQIADGLWGERTIDARGMVVLPGGVDMHVHLTPAWVGDQEFAWADDFESGSKAAAHGGITTVGNMTFPRGGEGILDSLRRTAADAEARSVVDFVLHPVLMEAGEAAIAEIKTLPEHGHTSLKIFMIMAGFETDPQAYLRAMSEAGKAGILTLVHCEDGCVVSFLARRLVAQGRGSAANYPDARPIYAESVAVARAVAFAEAAEAPVYLVHISSREALEVAAKARARGLPVYVETRPAYLHHTADRYRQADGALYAGSPPMRYEDDTRALWAGLSTGSVQTCCTDHAPWQREPKLDPSLDVSNLLNGMAELDFMLPLLYSEGVHGGKLSLERFVEVTSTNAAKLFGLYPRKGTLAVGSDADLVVWDPEATGRVRADAFASRADHTIYEGWEMRGLPRHTISRGELIVADGELQARPGRGRLVSRDPVTLL